MKTFARLLPLAALLVAVATIAPVLRAAHEGQAAADKSASVRHPLRGTIVEVRPEPTALLVKHEDIPGFMPSMTMLFKVDAATLQVAKKGQTITASLVERDGELWLEDVKPALPVPSAGVLFAVDAKTDAAWLTKARAEYPVDFCPVCDDKIAREASPKVPEYIYRVAGKPDRLVRFCADDDCVPNFKKDADKYLKTIDDGAPAKK